MAKQALTANSNITPRDGTEQAPSPQSESGGFASRTGDPTNGGPRRRDFGNLLQLPDNDPKNLKNQVARFRELLELDPKDQSSWVKLGRSLMEMGRPAEAIEPLRRAPKSLPERSGWPRQRVTSGPVTKSTPSCDKLKRDSTNAEIWRLD